MRLPIVAAFAALSLIPRPAAGQVSVAAPAMPVASPAAEAGVRAALEHYLTGQATGDPEAMRRAFHPEARMTFVREGKVVVMPISEYIGRFTGKAPGDEAMRKRRIASIEIAGTTAIGRIELDFPTAFIVDYMTLLEDGGRWVIIAKSFHAAPRSR